MSINEIQTTTNTRMQKSIEALQHAFNKIRTGRAHPSILEAVMVDYYGNPTPINQVANVGIEDNRTLSVTPWEAKMVPEVEKAIMSSDLGLNPSTIGNLIRVPMPMLTEETRKAYGKQARAEAETAKVSVRNIRRDANTQLKNAVKDKIINEDEEKRAQDNIQKLTDRFTKDIDELLKKKEQDLLEI